MSEQPSTEIERHSRSRRTYEMRVRGASWAEISEALDCTVAQARQDVVNFQRTLRVDNPERAQLIQEEDDRIRAVISANWVMMEQGDDKASALVLKASAQLMKLHGLEQQQPKEEANQTIHVVTGTPQEFMDALRNGRSQGLENEEDIIEGDSVEDE